MKNKQDILACSFTDAARNHLLDGIRMSTRAKMEFFEEMLDFAWQVGAIKPVEVRNGHPEVNKERPPR